MKRFDLRVDDETHKWLRKKAYDEYTSINKIIVEILQERQNEK